MTSHWTAYHQRWARLEAPLRPDDDVVSGFATALRPCDDHVLLLGVTPELARLGRRLTAMDRSPGMLTHIWPGDTPRAQAQLGDWLSPPFEDAAFSAVIGDGSLSVLRWPQDYRISFAQASRLLRPGGRMVLRLFLTPDEGETLSALRAAVHAGEVKSFHAFKWRLAMALLNGDPNIPVTAIRDGVANMFANRAELGRMTGWSEESIDTIDVYDGSADVYSFPNLAQLRATIDDTFGEARLIACGAYPLAERCPLLVLERV